MDSRYRKVWRINQLHYLSTPCNGFIQCRVALWRSRQCRSFNSMQWIQACCSQAPRVGEPVPFNSMQWILSIDKHIPERCSRYFQLHAMDSEEWNIAVSPPSLISFQLHAMDSHRQPWLLTSSLLAYSFNSMQWILEVHGVSLKNVVNRRWGFQLHAMDSICLSLAPAQDLEFFQLHAMDSEDIARTIMMDVLGLSTPCNGFRSTSSRSLRWGGLTFNSMQWIPQPHSR